MGRFIRRSLVVLAVLGIVGLGIALWAYRDIPAAELEARYAGPTSRFINIDGVRMHYRDEGTGPVVMLFHANFSNLIDWDPWVEALKDRYRVVRVDMTSHGLTGPGPDGRLHPAADPRADRALHRRARASRRRRWAAPPSAAPSPFTTRRGTPSGWSA